MDEQLKSPCIGCVLEKEDKNNPECKECPKRCQYISAIGDMSSSLPDDQMEAVVGVEKCYCICNTCKTQKPADDFDMVKDGSRKRKNCRVCHTKYYTKPGSKKQESKPKDSTMEKEIIYLFAPFADSKVLKDGQYPTFQAYTGDEFNNVLRNGDLSGAGEVLEVELICRHKIKETVTYTLED